MTPEVGRYHKRFYEAIIILIYTSDFGACPSDIRGGYCSQHRRCTRIPESISGAISNRISVTILGKIFLYQSLSCTVNECLRLWSIWSGPSPVAAPCSLNLLFFHGHRVCHAIRCNSSVAHIQMLISKSQLPVLLSSLESAAASDGIAPL